MNIYDKLKDKSKEIRDQPEIKQALYQNIGFPLNYKTPDSY